MLQSIRNGSRSWGAKIIIGLMVAAMALFGVESLFSAFGRDPNQVASVNGEPIMRQQVEVEVQRAMRSGQVPPEQERALRNDVLDQLITQELLGQYADDGGFHLSDEQIDQVIVTLPEFQDGQGRFNADIFRNQLGRAGYTPLAFREELRNDLKRSYLQQGLAQSDFVLPSERERMLALQNQQRSFRYVMLDQGDIDFNPNVTDEQVSDYYDTHPERFERPEQVKVEYVVIDRQEMAESVEVDDAALRRAYRAQSQTSDRQMSHIMVTFGDERSREEAKARAEQALAAIEGGESFEQAAQEYSDDTASAEQGGDLGVVSPGIMGEAFDDAAFSLAEGETSGLVEMGNAFHVLRVTSVEGPSFEEQRESLEQTAALDEVNDDFNRQVQRLIDESFAADDLQSVAEDLGLTLYQTDWITRDGGTGVLSEPGVMDEAFTDDVLEEGYNSQVIELDDDRRLVLRAADHRDATLLPLDEVRSDIEGYVAAAQRQNALQEEAQRLIEALRDDESVDIDWQEASDISRQGPTTLPATLVDGVFAMPRPVDGDSSYASVLMPASVAVVALDSVSTPESGEGDQASEFVARISEQLRAQAAVQGLIEQLRDDADIER
ncbi:SurA N-terminal domain-containing protein [Halomonas sp. PAMB 3232]|uniref:SurA N-terminal domain-containing protein n=1 Tax=Halomonas sp. PAMB 3232 TaxID=3075221 RepID=UPI0028989F0E|nr:SurA N-terminal domain-containing protein [Halomonas sp. PAMB 3232]WNL40428.1 SurA N-terminal domain-containing protein [Halomonas sp. PAMB 3232]